jgi:3-methyl-2-oxobutanoate hydroxymethyltransferase
MHGYPSTLNATTELICQHIEAVRKGAPKKFLIGDMPFLSYRKDLASNMSQVERLFHAGAEAIKIEGAIGNIEFIQHCVQSGVPVMGHLGLTPQFIHQFGGFRVQGRGEDGDNVLEQALRLEDAGCFGVVLECVPQTIAGKITERLKIPIIGIGAGLHCDGQVLVLQDLLGANPDFKPKFLRTYLDGFELIKNALNTYDDDVKNDRFPGPQESYE